MFQAKRLALAVALTAAILAVAEEPTPVDRAYAKAEQTERAIEVMRLKKQVRQRETNLRNARRAKPSQRKGDYIREQRRSLADAQRQLADMRAGRTVVYPKIAPSNMRAGACGGFANEARQLRVVTVTQIVDANTAIVTPYGWDASVWVNGVPTTGLVDDGVIRQAMYVYVTGTRTYVTVLGSQRTIFEADYYVPPHRRIKKKPAP